MPWLACKPFGDIHIICPQANTPSLVRHSPNFIFIFILFFLFFFFFRRQGFRMITFDRQAGPLQNFNRSHVMVIGRSVSFSDPARPPGGGVGRPKTPKSPPRIFFFWRFKTPGTFLSGIFFFQLKKFHHPPPPTPPPPSTCTPPPSPQNTHPNPRAIINNPNNCSMTYRL